jgi:hypothetical protein
MRAISTGRRATKGRHATLVHVARDAWEEERFPPGSALRALIEVLETAWDERARRGLRGRRENPTGDNLLDYLAVEGIEERIILNARERNAINLALLRLTIEGHELLLRFTQRHGLLRGDAAATAAELARMRAVADVRMREDERPASAVTSA